MNSKDFFSKIYANFKKRILEDDINFLEYLFLLQFLYLIGELFTD